MQPSGGFRELWRGGVNTWECDHMGHMNVQFYMQKAHEAAGWLAQLLGMEPEALRPREHYLRFRRETRGGDSLVMRGGVLAVAEGRLEIGMELIDAETEEVVTSVFVVAAPERLDGKAAAALKADWSGERRPRGPLPEPALASRSDMAADRRQGFFETYRGMVGPMDCDRRGVMAAPAVMGRFVQGVWHAGTAVGAGPRFYRAGHVSAGLYYHIHHYGEAKAGDRLQMLSAIVEVGQSSHRWLHKLYDAAGRLIASDDTVGIHIDPETRRPKPWPEAISQRSRARLLAPPADSMVSL